jgi:acetyl-CoA C-acetyltransferase
MRDVVICEPVRTPVGRYGGTLASLSAADLGAQLVAELLRRTHVSGDAIDDVVLGQCYPSGEAPAIGRVVALDADLPPTVGGMQIDRRCGSGLQAVITAAMQVHCGMSALVIAGGTESMSQAEYYSTDVRWGARAGGRMLHDRLERGRITAGGRRNIISGGMIETAENLRRDFGIARGEQDELSVESHRRAVAAQAAGCFDDEIIPVAATDRRGHATTIDRDEHPRADATLEALARLKPVMVDVDPEATVTAGNASGQNDGAAVCIVTERNRADALGLRIYATIRAWAIAGVEPRSMGLGPVPATALALERAGLTFADVDLIELNEAFAAQVIACTRAWNVGAGDLARINVHGSGIALGHPVGATGARILATMLHELHRRDASYALETLCIGGGQGIAAVFERSS